MIGTMLTYDPPQESALILSGDKPLRISEPIQAQCVGYLREFLDESPRPLFSSLVALYADAWAAHPKIINLPRGMDLVYDCKDDQSVRLSVGKLGQLQDHRQKLTTEARLLQNDLQSLDVLSQRWMIGSTVVEETDSLGTDETRLLQYDQRWLIGTNVIAGTVFEDPNSLDTDQPGLLTPSPCLFPTQTGYQQVVQEELYHHAVTVVLQARKSLQNALARYRSRIRLVSIVIGRLLTGLTSSNIFCSVLWEKRRWFLFHGARPPNPVQQALWACLQEACSGSTLA
jgi:hypothetical protein